MSRNNCFKIHPRLRHCRLLTTLTPDLVTLVTYVRTRPRREIVELEQSRDKALLSPEALRCSQKCVSTTWAGGVRFTPV